MGMEYMMVIKGKVVEQFKVSTTRASEEMADIQKFLKTLSVTERSMVSLVDEYSAEYAEFNGEGSEKVEKCWDGFCSEELTKVFSCEFGYVDEYYYKGYRIDVSDHFGVSINCIGDDGFTKTIQSSDSLEDAVKTIEWWRSFD